MQPEQIGEFSIAKLLAGIAGSFVSLRFMHGTLIQRIILAVGGAALSYYATTPFAMWMGARDAEGLIGFFIGMFGMAIVSKIYEVIHAADATLIAGDIWEWIKRKWGA